MGINYSNVAINSDGNVEFSFEDDVIKEVHNYYTNKALIPPFQFKMELDSLIKVVFILLKPERHIKK